MDFLEFAEARGLATLAVARKDYDDSHERTYKLVTALVAGGGAVGAVALSRFQPGELALTWAPLSALALSWLGAGGWLAWVGLRPNEVSAGNSAQALLDYFDDRIAAGRTSADAELAARKAEVKLDRERLQKYLSASSRRAHYLGIAYRLAACSPVAPLIVAAYCGLN